MKHNQRQFLHIATLFFLSTIGIALLSWIGNTYEADGVQNLWSAEGLRFLLRNAVSSYVATPALGIVIILFMGLGVASYGGMLQTLWNLVTRRKAWSLKERRALILSLVTLLIYTLLIVAVTFTPWTLLQNVTGTLHDSPFTKGIYYIVSLGIGAAGSVYGWVSGRLRTDRDVIRGMGSLFIRCYDYFIVLFFIVQFFLCLNYTNLPLLFGLDTGTMHIVFQLCCYLPLSGMLFQKNDHQIK